MVNIIKTKNEQYCIVSGIQNKESSDGNKIIGGYIATTHLDSGFEHPEYGYVRDKIDKELLDEWAKDLNEGVPRANKVSIRHDRSDPVVAGAAIKGTAEVIQMPDGEYGLYVDSVIDSTHENFEETVNRLDIGTYDSHSVEFNNSIYDIHDNKDEGYSIRTLHPGTKLVGYALASRPMNEYAIRIKELNKLTELNKSNNKIVNEDSNKLNEKDSSKLNKEEKTVKEEIKPIVEEIKMTEEDKNVNDKPVEAEAKTNTISEADMKAFNEFKEQQVKLAKENEMKSFREEILKDVAEMNKKEVVESKVAVNKENDIPEVKEVKEFKELSIMKKEMKSDGTVVFEKSLDTQFKMAAALADKAGITESGKVLVTKSADARIGSFKVEMNGRFIESKGLGITTNQGSDYYLSAAELSDIFDPVIYNALSQPTVTFNIINKEDFSNKGNNLVQFTVKTAINNSLDTTNNGFYTGNAVTLGNTTRLKVATKFKKQQVGIEIDGDMIAAARGGPIGDVFAQEVRDSTTDLLQYANKALFAETGAETDKGVIGFEYITDSAGNTTLYGITRSSTTQSANAFLNPTSAGDTYINGSSADLSITNLRAAKRQALKEGAMIGNLVFIGDHIQGDKLRGIYDAAQRMAPTSSRFGFEGMLSFDGIPFFEDKDCNDDDVFLVDLETHKIAMWVPPTLEMLGKDSDSQKGFIKMYWATYNRHPRRMVQIYGNATS